MKDTGCRMTKAELAKYGVLYLFLDLAVSALFYRSWIAFLAFLPGMYWFLKEMGKRLEKKRRERLEQGFLMGMRYVSTALSAGYSIEHAFEQALVEMKNRFFVGDELETVTPAGSETLMVEDIVIEGTGEHVAAANVPGQRVRVPCGEKLHRGDMLRGPVRNRKGC